MSVPAKKRTKGSKGKRNSHSALKEITLGKCSKCGYAVEPHKTCPNCGTYKNKEVVSTKLKSKSKSK